MDPLSEAALQVAAVPVTLIGLTFVATIQAVGLEQVFDTRLFQRYLGKGVDGQPSIYFKGYELRPWISTAVGILLATTFQLHALSYGLAINPNSLAPGGALLDQILTGLIIGGGTKAVKGAWKRFDTTRKEIG